jgi:hypothetical protein
MAKKERKETETALKSDLARRRQEEDAYVASREVARSEQEQRANALIGGLAATGGFDPTQLGYLRGVGATQVATGGYDMPELAEARAGYRGLAETGGVSPEEAGAMTRRATRGVTSIYDVLSAEAARRRTITGGYGGESEIARLARQSAEKAAEATTGAEAEVAKMRQTGRLEGVRGLAGLTTEEAAGRRAAVTSLTGLETSVAGGVRAAAQLSVDQQIATGTEILKRIQLGQQVSESDLSLLSDLSKQPGVFNSIIGAVGAGAGVISALRK